jgi:crossover junction endodeoxyribonuclease RuvC
MAVEELFFNTNITTGISVAQGRGVILLAGRRAGISVFEYTPLQVKQAVVGYGRAEKNQVIDMVRRIPQHEGRARSRRCGGCGGHCHLSRTQRDFTIEQTGR